MVLSCHLRLAAVLAVLAPAAHAQDSGFVSFHTPGEAVLCALSWQGSDGWLRCDVYSAKVDPAQHPADCDGDWGHFFTLHAIGPAFRSCEGDMAWEQSASAELLPGQKIAYGPFTCRNDAGRVICTSPDNHGFTLSADQQSLH